MSIDQLTEYAQSGQLVLHLDPEKFDEIIKACDAYLDELMELQGDAQSLSQYKLGCAEDHLPSGARLAQFFQSKAAGGHNSAESTFQSHIERVQEMKGLFHALRTNIQSTDSGNAKTFNTHGN